MLLTTEEPLFIAGFLLTLLVVFSVLTRKAPLPPGPSPSIFTGNEKDLPQTDPWKTFAEWSKTYGKPYFSLLPSYQFDHSSRLRVPPRDLPRLRPSHNRAQHLPGRR